MNEGELLERHGTALATIRAFAEGSGAERVAVLLDAGEEALVVECEPFVSFDVVRGEERIGVSPRGAPAASAGPIPTAPSGTAIELDLVQGEILAPLGVVTSLADGVLALARALGGRSVASADFPTRDPAMPLTVAARDGEGVVLAAGELQFEY